MTDVTRMLTPEVLIIGGGPAGLTAAAHIAGCVHGDVLVLDREKQAGGIPRHSDHLGYGIRDMRRVISGPAYAQRLVRAAGTAGAVIHTQAMVTGWDGDGNAQVTSPRGRLAVHAKAVVLATGARERPRTARLIPGDRPGGVYTTGQLQNLVHLHHGVPGQRAVVVGGELVSWSAVVTLREAGARTVLMTTQYPSPESYAAFNIGGKLALRVPVAARSRVVRVMGRPRVEAIEIENLDSGDRRVVECDTVVFTGDWIPDHELARLAGLDLDPGTGGPLTDTALRTSRPGTFAAGNLLHPVDTADIAALDGRHVADQVRAWLAGQRPDGRAVRLRTQKPFRWVAPGLLRPGDPAPSRRRLLLWTDDLVRMPHVTAIQDGRVIGLRRLPWPASPGRVFRLPWSLLSSVDPGGGDVTIGLYRS
jgi:thioredoxin reductase